MISQGRLFKVMIMLVASMTAGALLLLALEGKPIKPMAYSLSSQTQVHAASKVLGATGVNPDHWSRIEVAYVHSDRGFTTDVGPAGAIAQAFHFLISDDRFGNDGQIFATQQWINQKGCQWDQNFPGADKIIRIGLVCDANNTTKTPNQSRQLEDLVYSLKKHCQIIPNIAWE